MQLTFVPLAKLDDPGMVPSPIPAVEKMTPLRLVPQGLVGTGLCSDEVSRLRIGFWQG